MILILLMSIFSAPITGVQLHERSKNSTSQKKYTKKVNSIVTKILSLSLNVAGEGLYAYNYCLTEADKVELEPLTLIRVDVIKALNRVEGINASPVMFPLDSYCLVIDWSKY